MLKKLSVLLTMGVVLVLVACSGRRETTTVCVIDGIDFYGETVPGYMAREFDAVGDRVTISRERWVFDFEGDEDYIDEFVEILEGEIELMRMMMVDGVTTELTSVTDTTITWVTTTNFDELSDADLRMFIGDYDFISLELSVEIAESEGATCNVINN